MTRLEEIRAEIARLEVEAKELGAQKWVVDDVGVSYKYSEFNQHSLSRYETQGRVFDTQAEAVWFSKFERAQAKLRSLNRGFVPDWGDHAQRKLYWSYDFSEDIWAAGHTFVMYAPERVYFASDDELKAAFKAMGDQMDDIKPFKGV